MIQYDINWCELKVKTNVVRINYEIAMRNDEEYRLTVLDSCKKNLENKMFYCMRRKMNVLVVLVEANKETLFIRGKLVCCNIAWAIGKTTQKELVSSERIIFMFN